MREAGWQVAEGDSSAVHIHERDLHAAVDYFRSDEYPDPIPNVPKERLVEWPRLPRGLSQLDEIKVFNKEGCARMWLNPGMMGDTAILVVRKKKWMANSRSHPIAITLERDSRASCI